MANKVEKLPLKDQLKHTLEEARIVLPGIQALFGFQLIVVFNESFNKKLDLGEQRLHLLALLLTAVAVGLTMTPSALHRQAEPKSVSDRLVRNCTFFLTLGMVPLMLAISLDLYLMCRLILQDSDQAKVLSIGSASLFLLLWYVYPWLARRRINEPAGGPEEEAEEASRRATYVA